MADFCKECFIENFMFRLDNIDDNITMSETPKLCKVCGETKPVVKKIDAIYSAACPWCSQDALSTVGKIDHTTDDSNETYRVFCDYCQFSSDTVGSDEEKVAEEFFEKEYNEAYLTIARNIAKYSHEGQTDKGGNPYILHPTAVANSVEGYDCKIVAYLHDVIEDTSETLEYLATVFPARIVEAVDAITKTPNISYSNYLAKVKENDIARIVKIADIKHNMDLSRIPNPCPKDYKRIEKYKKALDFLEG